jgi:hypothetical protein
LASAKEGEMEKLTKKEWSLVSFLLIILLIIVMAGFIGFAVVEEAFAERQLSLENGTLKVFADVMEVKGVPEEITDPEIAFQLVSGQLRCVVIGGKTIRYQPSDGVQYNERHWIVIPR